MEFTNLTKERKIANLGDIVICHANLEPGQCLNLDSVRVSGDEPIVKFDFTRFKDYAKRTLQRCVQTSYYKRERPQDVLELRFLNTQKTSTHF